MGHKSAEMLKRPILKTCGLDRFFRLFSTNTLVWNNIGIPDVVTEPSSDFHNSNVFGTPRYSQYIRVIDQDFNGGYWNRNPTMWKLPVN